MILICILDSSQLINQQISLIIIDKFISGATKMTHMSTVNPETIRRHVTNNSPAKNAHQFSKTKRFPVPNPSCPIAFYCNSSELSRRRTSLGVGRKSDFTKDLTVSPASTLYKHKSIFDEKQSRGRSFGLSRDKSPDTSYLVPQMQKVPGPGQVPIFQTQYQNQVETRMNTSYTMRARTIDFIESNKTSNKTPGPGEYESIQLEPNSGRFMCSKFGDSKFAKITDNGPRFVKLKDSPGPSSYREGDGLSNSAKYVLSQHKGRGCRSFAKNFRSHFTDDFSGNKRKNPGPGTYERPSEFGVYADAKFYKTLGTFK